MSIITSFKMFLQTPTEVEIARHNIQAEEWVEKTFSAACRGDDSNWATGQQ
jgi:hypothetical protein